MDEVQNNATLPLIGDKAPAFHAVTTQGDINFPEDYKGKWVILWLFLRISDYDTLCHT